MLRAHIGKKGWGQHMKKDLAIQQGSTMFEKTVKPAKDRKTILQSVASNTKIGKGGNIITKGIWIGMPMYSLTLEERATCPKDCRQWNNCYGNNSPFRIRVQIDETFYDKLEKELDKLNKKHTQGFVIRLHVLGDFPDKHYVEFWLNMLLKYQNCYVFSYTHHSINSDIGREINIIRIAMLHRRRFQVRFSDSDVQFRANMETKENATGIICPEQTGKTQSCLTCGLCWGIDKPITFLPH